MNIEPARTLKDIPKVTEPTPLKGEALKTFYVETDPARDPDFPTSNRLQEYLYESPPPLRLLFASHPGAGKSTELNRLMDHSKNEFWFVYFSVREELNIDTLTSADLILALMEKLYQQGRAEQLIRDKRVIEPIRSWLNEIVKESNIRKKVNAEANVGVGIDGLLAQIVGVIANIKETFLLSHESAETVRQVLKPRIAELRDYCNQVIVEIMQNLAQTEPNRKLLIIVDDTDKLDIDVAQQMFVNHSALLSDLHAPIIYTVPLFLIHSPDRVRLESYFDTLTLPMIKTFTTTGKAHESGRQVLRDIVYSRISSSLIDSDALNDAITKTGGILRDLLRVIQNASQIARYADERQITVGAVRSSLNRLKTFYSNSVYGRGDVSTEDLYKKMVDVFHARHGRVPLDERLRLLLYAQAVIEYNGHGWYKLHPLMEEVLKEMGRLDGVA
jgi:hypothetical protein